MKDIIILLVVDNVDDAELTARALGKDKISREIGCAHDGAGALGYEAAND